MATQGSVNTRMGVERCVRFAFELAAQRPRRHLTLVHKTNVLTFAGDLWHRTVTEVSPEFPEITWDYNHVDAACIYLVEQPRPLRRHRHRQPLRGHSDGPGRCGQRGHRLRRLRQPQPGSNGAVALRARARRGARHRRQGDRQPVGGHPLRRPHARAPRGARRGAANPQGAVANSPTPCRPHHPHNCPRRPWATPLQKGSENAHHPDREDLDGRRARRLGRRQGARAHPHHALRLRRVRGDPGLPDLERGGRVPSGRPHPPALRLGQGVHDRHPLHGRRDHRGDPRGRPGQRAHRRLLPASARLPRLRRNGTEPVALPGQRVDRGVALGHLSGRRGRGQRCRRAR